MGPRVDVCIVGGGIVGLATAHALQQRFDGLSLAVVEKEPALAAHQTGHNSGVLHSGLYYKPGSLKARLCVSGQRRMADFCTDEGIAVRRTGKLVIATRRDEVPALEELHRRGDANGLYGIERLGPDGIRTHEPSAIGVAALYVPESGVVDYPTVARRLGERLRAAGADVLTGHAVRGITSTGDAVHVSTDASTVTAGLLVNCAGLHADTVARMAGLRPNVRIVPFRGEYYELNEPAASLVNALIYPVPDPRFPFLGVHFTRRIDGTVEVGPNAVLAAGREHYRGTKADLAELRAIIGYAGFRRVAGRYWRTGLDEMITSSSRRLYARRSRRLVPAITANDLEPAGSGVRAQAVSAEGKLLDDFAIMETGRGIHVLNAPSPAATASLSIGDHIADVASAHLAPTG